MTTALASLRKHGNVLLLDFLLLAAIYLLPSISHLLALPLYQLEPMRLALLVALLFTSRLNAYVIAFTLPLASVWISGHPAPLKALLMGIELSLLVATYGWFNRRLSLPAFAALAVAIVVGKGVYYALKSLVLQAGWMEGDLVSTPWQSQLALAIGTALVFGAIVSWREKYAPERRAIAD
jgi:hypothetical protein